MSQDVEQQANIKNLLWLAKENPDLRIVPMVDYEVCQGDDYSSWMGSWGKARIDYIYIPDFKKDKFLNAERIYFKSEDEDAIKDELFDYFGAGNPSWSNEYIVEKLEEKYKELEWEKVITVFIGLP